MRSAPGERPCLGQRGRAAPAGLPPLADFGGCRQGVGRPGALEPRPAEPEPEGVGKDGRVAIARFAAAGASGGSCWPEAVQSSRRSSPQCAQLRAVMEGASGEVGLAARVLHARRWARGRAA